MQSYEQLATQACECGGECTATPRARLQSVHENALTGVIEFDQISDGLVFIKRSSETTTTAAFS